MRLVATEYLTLDGVFEEPGHWSFPYFDENAAQFKFDELKATDAQLLGRITYEGFARAWPTMEGTGDFGVKMNTMPKYVVTSTLRELSWSGSHRIDGDDALDGAVRKLKAQRGGDLLLAGSGQLFRALSKAGLIDLYRFMVHPVILGEGKRLFTDDTEKRELKLVDTRTFSKGIVVLEYEPA
ncbi:MAG TPA: dihydrofolate reductase family protein [Candidatus Dormibacteraeota bacterium]|nr:dihydrofolate reductase family protein [Candidatus Dormibacteraeota bacterium]